MKSEKRECNVCSPKSQTSSRAHIKQDTTISAKISPNEQANQRVVDTVGKGMQTVDISQLSHARDVRTERFALGFVSLTTHMDTMFLQDRMNQIKTPKNNCRHQMMGSMMHMNG
jgi:hypothetical protein